MWKNSPQFFFAEKVFFFSIIYLKLNKLNHAVGKLQKDCVNVESPFVLFMNGAITQILDGVCVLSQLVPNAV